VWERDGGQCTYVSPEGRRCTERQFLEFDHIEPVARGGQASVENTRLRCRSHNQYEAERVFGAAFMQRKRREALEQRARKRSSGKIFPDTR
jgi:5-methylcytosine-specific restriction endonuclease McrA